MQRRFYLFLLVTILYSCTALSQGNSAGNPVIYADVPDMSMIRVGDTYYMSSTTMHMAPGVPIMKSKDLVNWELVNYVFPDGAPDWALYSGRCGCAEPE